MDGTLVDFSNIRCQQLKQSRVCAFWWRLLEVGLEGVEESDGYELLINKESPSQIVLSGLFNSIHEHDFCILRVRW